MFRKLRDKLNKSKIGMNVNESLLGRAIDSLSNFIVYAYATLAGDTALKEDSAVNWGLRGDVREKGAEAMTLVQRDWELFIASCPDKKFEQRMKRRYSGIAELVLRYG